MTVQDAPLRSYKARADGVQPVHAQGVLIVADIFALDGLRLGLVDEEALGSNLDIAVVQVHGGFVAADHDSSGR